MGKSFCKVSNSDEGSIDDSAPADQSHWRRAHHMVNNNSGSHRSDPLIC
jgi:hypothetical protein